MKLLEDNWGSLYFEPKFIGKIQDHKQIFRQGKIKSDNVNTKL